jgi:hypothetical protein
MQTYADAVETSTTTLFHRRTIQDPALVDMDPFVQVRLRCHVDKTTYHREKYQRKNSSRLNHLICLKQSVDRNAHCRYGTHPEVMEDQYFYTSAKFYCVHMFLGKVNMLIYSGYRKTEIYHVEDRGDGRISRHQNAQSFMCKVSHSVGKIPIIDKPEMTEKCLRKGFSLPV